MNKRKEVITTLLVYGLLITYSLFLMGMFREEFNRLGVILSLINVSLILYNMFDTLIKIKKKYE